MKTRRILKAICIGVGLTALGILAGEVLSEMMMRRPEAVLYITAGVFLVCTTAVAYYIDER